MARRLESTAEAEAITAAFPSKHVAPVTVQDLPDPQPLGGEFVIFPFITANVGLVFLSAAYVGALTQFFINMEIERYTLATGETALTGFSRSGRHWGAFFAVGTVLANMWPGWATSAATVLTYAAGGGNVNLIAIGALVIIGLRSRCRR